VTARAERFTEPAILPLLREGAIHGYELPGRLRELSAADRRIDLGDLYRLLRALGGEGLVSSQWQAESGPPRRICRLTASGADLPGIWAGALRDMRAGIGRFLARYGARG
jgi:DNA-binding PadR family transcriptional regulator